MELLLLPVACLCLAPFGTSAQQNGAAALRFVTEEQDVILPCSLSAGDNIEQKFFDWRTTSQKDGSRKEVFLYDAGKHYNNGYPGQSEQFKGRVFYFSEGLKHGNASIVIRNTRWSDSGNYTCDFRKLRPHQMFSIELIVDPILKDRSGENIPGASPEPYVTNLDQTDDWALLQCVVRGAFPEPTVEWWDSSGNIIPAEKPRVLKKDGRYHVTLQTTVTKTDNYSCVSTQTTIMHQIPAHIKVHFTDDSPGKSAKTSEFSTGLIIAVVSVLCTLLVGGVVFAVLVAQGRITLKCKKESPSDTTVPLRGGSST